MEIVYRRCCGIDVHKDSLAACISLGAEGEAQPQQVFRRFGTFTRDVLELASWLRQHQITHVVMEATGVYWKPIWNVLEEQFGGLIAEKRFEIRLVNPEFVKALPGRKSDRKDGQRLAELLQYNLLPASYVPSVAIRDLRDLTRYRVTLVQDRGRISARVQKLLEQANIKLGTVLTDVLGVSGRLMLQALAEGQAGQDVVKLAKGKLRSKSAALALAADGRLRDHHRFLLRELLAHWDDLDRRIKVMDAEIEARCAGWEDTIRRWDTVPGVDRIGACALLAEIGDRPEQFPTVQQLAAWAGVAPGCNESAGKRKSTRTRRGSPWLRRLLCQIAWAASHTKNTYVAARYRRLAARRGAKRAIIALAHTLLVSLYILQKRGCDFRDLGADYFVRLNTEKRKRYLLRELERLGIAVQAAAA